MIRYKCCKCGKAIRGTFLYINMGLAKSLGLDGSREYVKFCRKCHENFMKTKGEAYEQ